MYIICELWVYKREKSVYLWTRKTVKLSIFFFIYYFFLFFTLLKTYKQTREIDIKFLSTKQKNLKFFINLFSFDSFKNSETRCNCASIIGNSACAYHLIFWDPWKVLPIVFYFYLLSRPQRGQWHCYVLNSWAQSFTAIDTAAIPPPNQDFGATCEILFRLPRCCM